MSGKYCSIFNDVLGPIMTGPSSSHSAGCARIGLMARCLLGRKVLKADVVFEERGSYPSTYIGQGSSYGFTGGLMGMSTDDPELKNAVELAAERNICINFKKADLCFHHPNEARIDIYSDDENPANDIELSVMTYSTGGGMFLISSMDGFSVHIDGGSRQAFVCCGSRDAALKTEKVLGCSERSWSREVRNGTSLYTVKLLPGEDVEDIVLLKNVSGVRYVRFAEIIMPVAASPQKPEIFFNAREAMLRSVEAGLAPWELAIEYECSVGVITRDMVLALAEKTMMTMLASTVPPDPLENKKYGFLDYRASDMMKAPGTAGIGQLGIMGPVMHAAVSVMENSCAHNIVAAAPTAGSSGVIPAAVVTAGRAMGMDDEIIIKGLLAAGLVGAFIGSQATFGGEVGACQAENGSAGAMAAAGLTQMLGGNTGQCFMAASLALQNQLGLICDPVAGLTEIPCIGRNVSTAANAVMSAFMVLGGFDPVIPLDETILTMAEVGRKLPAEFRCTCGGGLCTTPAAMEICRRLKRSV